MKLFRILFFLTVLCTTSVLQIRAQGTTGTSPIQFREASWDFGQIKETDGKVSHVFTFTNRGNDPFVIEHVATTCGCTTPEYSREPILSGRTGTVNVIFDPEGRPGPFSKNITITFHNGTQSKLVITGTVTGKPRTVEEEYPIVAGEGLRVSRQTAGMGYLPKGGTKGTAVEYMNDSGSAIILDVNYEKPHGYFKVVFSPQTLPPGGKGVMTMSYNLRNQEHLWGRITDNFQITVNGIETKPAFQATGIVTEDFSGLTREQLNRAPKADFSAQYYHFGDKKSGQECQRDFAITNSGQEPLIIRNITAGERTTLTLTEGTTIAPGKTKTFTATLKIEGLPAGRFMDSSTIIINDPQRPMRELRLAAVVY